MPTNLYGEGDNFHTQFSHVIPGLISRMYDAKIKKNQFLKFGELVKQKETFCMWMILQNFVFNI